MKFLAQFLQDGNGQNSSMRGLMILLGIVIIGIYIYKNIVMAVHVDFLPMEAALLTGVVFAKVVQSFSPNDQKPKV